MMAEQLSDFDFVSMDLVDQARGVLERAYRCDEPSAEGLLAQKSFSSGNRPSSKPLWDGDIGAVATVHALAPIHITAIEAAYRTPGPIKFQAANKIRDVLLQRCHCRFDRDRIVFHAMAQILAHEYPFCSATRLNIPEDAWERKWRRHWRNLRKIRAELDEAAVTAFSALWYA